MDCWTALRGFLNNQTLPQIEYRKKDIYTRFRRSFESYHFSRNTFNYYIYLLLKAKYIRRERRGYYSVHEMIPEMNVEELRNVAFRRSEMAEAIEKIRNDHRWMTGRVHGEPEFFSEKEFAL